VDEFDESNIQAQATRGAIEESGISLHSVWIRYFALTGRAGEFEVDAYLNGSLELSVHERDLVSHAVNELIDELPPRPRAPYSNNGTATVRDQSQEKQSQEQRRRSDRA
jgi:hypothetical protein